MKKKKILFLGETYRADAITWMNGLKQYGDFEIITWELKTRSHGFNRFLRLLEYCTSIFKIRQIVRIEKPDMVIAERTTSYGFLAALSGVRPIAVAQQGLTDLWPETSIMLPVKKIIQYYAFHKATLIHAWGKVMTYSMENTDVDMTKVMVLPKGIDLSVFGCEKTGDDATAINAIVTRSLLPEYRHDIILKAFAILHEKGYDFKLTIVGDGAQSAQLKSLAEHLKISNKVLFTGRIHNSELPVLLSKSNYYISMPVTEGVSASLFEAMATCCYPIVTDIIGNQCWITHRENGQLITTDDYKMLASEMIWAIENPEHRMKVVSNNRKFVEENANYSINMKMIAAKYHALINTTKTNQHVRN